MSYFEFFSSNLCADDDQNKHAIRGTCDTLCPKEEVAMRQKEKMVHVLEVFEGSRILVKSYSRSAADSFMAKPHLLRPYSVLKKTLQHLLFVVAHRMDVPTAVLYDFLNDPAVRQDMTIQRLKTEQCAELLEPMVRFYVYFGYKLSDAPLNDYDPVLNKKYLLECLKWYLSCMDQSADINKLGDMFFKMGLNKGHEFSNDRVLMESLYILCNLDDVHPLARFLSLDKDMRSKPLLKLSYKIAIANMLGHFVQATRLAAGLCPLTLCGFCEHLPSLQRRALQALSQAYQSPRLTVPLPTLRHWLMMDSDQQTREVCQNYGVSVEEDRVKFLKGSFKMESVRRIKHIGCEKLNLPIEEMLSYKTV